MMAETAESGSMAENENLLRSIYTKSVDMKHFLATWKESMLASANFDLSQALHEKAVKMQSAMSLSFFGLHFLLFSHSLSQIVTFVKKKLPWTP